MKNTILSGLFLFYHQTLAAMFFLFLFSGLPCESYVMVLSLSRPSKSLSTKMASSTTCTFCGSEKEKLLKCSRCKSSWYCNRECQISDWKVHKMICTALKEVPNLLLKTSELDSAKLADYVNSELNTNGFCILNDFLPEDTASNILSEVKALDGSGIFKDGQLSGGLTSSEDDEKYSEKKIRGDRIKWIEGSEPNVASIKELMTHVDNLVVKCSGVASCTLGRYDIQGRTKAMVACYPGNQTGYIRHIDNPDEDGRCLTSILYLNKGWTDSDGGKLRIYKTACKYDVEPLFNRLLLFWSDVRTPHEVLPSNAIRYAITMWYFDKKQREQAKERQKHKLMGEFGCEVLIKDMQMKKNERDQAQLKLDEESERLVKSLMTDDELDAMSELIKGHHNPRDMLTSYGISPSILDALLRVLNKRM